MPKSKGKGKTSIEPPIGEIDIAPVDEPVRISEPVVAPRSRFIRNPF